MNTDVITLGRLMLAAPGVALVSGAASTSGGGSAGGSGGGGPSGLTAIEIADAGGQSNFNYATIYDGAFAAMATAAGFYLSASSTTLPGYNDDGVGLFNLTTPDGGGNYSGSFVNNSDAATTLDFYNNTRFGNPSAAAANIATLSGEVATATVGTPGATYQSSVVTLTGGEISGVTALVCYWGETDCLQFTPASRALFKACVVRWMALVRAMYGKTAAQLPFFWFGPPYGLFPNLPSGPPTIREIWAEVAADPAQNAFWLVPQTYDTMSRNETQNATTGVCSGGNTDGGHRSAADNVKLFKRGALAMARAILASNGLSASLIPPALGQGLGPQITAANLSGTTLTLTIAHDGGNDLIVPLLASQGVGFAVMDGGSIAAPGNIILATACSRIDATHLSVTLASAPVNAHSACRLMYPWAGTYWSVQPDTEIGPGCAVTDNFSTISKPSGFDINASLGVGWGANMPLVPPVVVTGTGPSATAAWGIPLT